MPRRVHAFAPFQWLLKATNIGARNPRVLLLGAFASVIAFLGVLFVAGVILGSVLGQHHASTEALNPRTVMATSWPLMLLALVMPQLVMGGLAQLIHRVETDATAQVSDAFSGLRRNRILPLAGLIVIPLCTLAVTLLIYASLGGEHYLEHYFATMQQLMVGKIASPPQPEHPFAMMVATLALNWISYALQLFAPIQVMLGGRGTFGAILDSLQAFVRNLPAMFVGGVLGLMALFGAIMLTFVALVLGALLAKAMPIVGSLLTIVLSLTLAVIGILIWVACGYYGWRDMLDTRSPAAATPSPNAGIAM